MSEFELPSGLPEGPWQVSGPDGYFDFYRVGPKNRVAVALAESENYARAIAAIPAMVERIEWLERELKAADEKNDRLRTLNAEMRKALQQIAARDFDLEARDKARAILAKSEASS